MIGLMTIVAGIIAVAAIAFPVQTAFTTHPAGTPSPCDQPTGFFGGPFFGPPQQNSAGAPIPGFTTTVVVEKEVIPLCDAAGHVTGFRDVEITKKIIVTVSRDKVVTETLEVFAIVCDKTNLRDPATAANPAGLTITCTQMPLLP